MCEDAAPITALAFLQNDVSAVVNHEDNEEAANFRSLLSHLFAQPPVPLSPVSPSPYDPTRGSPSPSSSNSGSGEWTSELRRRVDDDSMMVDSHSDAANVEATEPGDDDPYELELRGGKPLSSTRFAQRTEVFESLLRFVGRKGRTKQPEGSLLDLVGNGE